MTSALSFDSVMQFVEQVQNIKKLEGFPLVLANRLVGNPESAAGIESLLGGLTLRARGVGATATMLGQRHRSEWAEHS